MVNRKLGVLINSLESFVGRTNSKIKFLEGIKRVKKADGGAFDNFDDNFSLGVNGKLTTSIDVFLEDTSSKAVPMVLRFGGVGELPSNPYNKQLVETLEKSIAYELENTIKGRDNCIVIFDKIVEEREEIVKFFESVWDKPMVEWTKEEKETNEMYKKDYLGISIETLKNIK